jgi:hypothetical protein
MKIYPIRLNGYGKFRAGSQLAIDAWKAAVQATMQEILDSYTPELRKGVDLIRATLLTRRDDARCERCGGKGIRDDREEWIILKRGKVCFKCNGSGIEPEMEPVFFRRRVIDTIQQSDQESIRRWARKVAIATDHQQPYKPILTDIIDLIRQDKISEISKLPH